ncbi:MAG: hypothetical protein L0099_12560 [Acidobacteria bacterium]|nr:hypothetical protein [Acidobacteriota bacterium]
MTGEHQGRLLEMIRNPRPGSKIAEAKAFGIDLTLNVRRLGLTPTERLEELQSFNRFLEEIRRVARQARP